MKSSIKLVAIYLIRIIMRLFYIFPVKKGRVIFNSYRGGQYSCNPKYITEYILNNNKNYFEIIWAFKEPEKYKYLSHKGIKVIRYTSLKRIYYEATSEFSINNVGSFSWLPTRKKQNHINTWHGGGAYKRVSLGESANDRIFKKTLSMTADETTDFVASSLAFEEKVIPIDFGYHGRVLKIGMPRNDIFFEQDLESIRKKVLESLKIDNESYIVLFAPTWRYDSYEKIEAPDFNMIAETLGKRKNLSIKILFRAHPNLKTKISGEYIDATSYPDMQELLVATDLLISDYSSCIWDFSILHRPCVLFVPDLEKYIEERGFVIDINKWGFYLSKNDKELKEILNTFTDAEAAKCMAQHQQQLGTYEHGNACRELYTLMMNRWNKHE